jgi:hypothetical protein
MPLLTYSRSCFIRLTSLRPFLHSEVLRRRNGARSRDGGANKTATAIVEETLRRDLCSLCVSTACDVIENLFTATEGNTVGISPWHSLMCKCKLGSSGLLPVKSRDFVA